MRSRSRSTTPVSRSQELLGAELARRGARDERLERRRAAPAGRRARRPRCARSAPGTATATSRASTPPTPTLKAFSTTTTRVAPVSASASGVGRERPEGRHAEHADPVAGVAPGVDRVLEGAEDRPHGHDHHVGAVDPVGRTSPPESRPVAAAKAAAARGMRLEGVELAQVREVADLGEGLGADHRADRDRVVGVEHLAGLVGRRAARRPGPGRAGRRPRRRGSG